MLEPMKPSEHLRVDCAGGSSRSGIVKSIGILTSLLLAGAFGTAPIQADEELTGTEVVADEIVLGKDTSFSAYGDVEIRTPNELIQAPRIIFDGERLEVFGPIHVTDKAGNVAKSEYGQLSADYQEMILRNIKAFYNRRLQIVADEEHKTPEGFIVFNNIAVTTCTVCQAGEEPIWYFQASALITDEVGERIYLKDAKFKIWEQTVFYMPWLSLANPSMGNASGFLTPEISFGGDEDLTVVVPYYHSISPATDLELSFGANSNAKFRLGYDLRHRFAGGWIDVAGTAPLNDRSLIEKDFIVKGAWDVNSDNQIRFLGTNTSDTNDGYPKGVFPDRHSLIFGEYDNNSDYGRTSLRLVTLDPLDDIHGNVSHNNLGTLTQLRWQSPDLLPLFDTFLGLTAEVKSINNVLDEVDYSSASLLGELRAITVFDSGISMINHVFVLGTGFDWNTGTITDNSTHAKIAVVTDLNYPLIFSSANATHVLEPFVQIAWVDENNPKLPYARSQDLQHWRELDRSRLVTPYQFNPTPGLGDGREVNVGVKYSVFGADNKFELTIGRTYKELHRDMTTGRKVFYEQSEREHYVVETRVSLGPNLDLNALVVTSNDLKPVRSDFEIYYSRKSYEFGISYERIDIDNQHIGDLLEAEGRKSASDPDPRDPKALSLFAKVPLGDRWSAFTNADLDLTRFANRTIEAGFVYAYNCLEILVTANRKLPTATNALSKTDYGIRLTLTSLTSAAGRSCLTPQ